MSHAPSHPFLEVTNDFLSSFRRVSKTIATAIASPASKVSAASGELDIKLSSNTSTDSEAITHTNVCFSQTDGHCGCRFVDDGDKA